MLKTEEVHLLLLLPVVEGVAGLLLLVVEEHHHHIIQEDHYYPFGGRHVGMSYDFASGNDYLFNGKEYIHELDWNGSASLSNHTPSAPAAVPGKTKIFWRFRDSAGERKQANGNQFVYSLSGFSS